MISNFTNQSNAYLNSLHQDRFKAFPKETARTLEPVDYMMDSRTGAMLAFDSVPTITDLYRSTTSFIA
jgi:hypothetical protein